MDNNSNSGVYDSIIRSGVTRRQIVHRVLGGLGASLALSAVAPAHPVLQHIHNCLAVGTAKARSWTPKFFDSRQDGSFTALAEDIVPGSAKAHVDRMVDLLLSVCTEEDQQDFNASLAAFEGESIHRFGQPYQTLSAAQRDEILKVASTGNLGGFLNKLNIDLKAQQHQGPETLRDHFENLKGWVVGVYYASEAGMRELGWTGQVFFTSFPGCSHQEEH